MVRYSRERILINESTILRVNQMLEKGTVKGTCHDIADEMTPGLILRVNRTYAVWYLKTRTRTVRISDMSNLHPCEARVAAMKARQQIERGEDPTDNLEVYSRALAFDEGEAEEIAWPPPRPDLKKRRREHGPWTVEDLIDEFIAWKIPRLREGYGPPWARHLRLPAFSQFAHLRVMNLKIEDLEQLRDSLLNEHPTSTAWRATQQLKEALSWAWRHQARRSGLGSTQYEWWKRLTLEYTPNIRTHTPTIDELARTLAIIDAFGLARGRAAAPGTLPALWAVVLTGQRTGPLVATQTDYVLPHAKREGWRIVSWPRAIMKSNRQREIPHALPVPAEAWEKIGSAATGDFVFPGRSGKHVTKSALNQLFLRLVGERGGKDVLNEFGVRRWTPHDARRTLASFLSDHRLGGAASAILDHRDQYVPEPERTADVTRLVYDRAQRLELKADGMAIWCKDVLAAYHRERALL